LIEGVDGNVFIIDGSLIVIEPFEFGAARGCFVIPNFKIFLILLYDYEFTN